MTKEQQERQKRAKVRLLDLLDNEKLYILFVGVNKCGAYNKMILQCFVVGMPRRVENVNLHIANLLNLRRDRFGNIAIRTQDDLIEQLSAALEKTVHFELL